MNKKIVILCMLSFMLVGYMAMAADTSGGIGPWIGELSSGGLVIIAIFLLGKYMFRPMKDLFTSLSKGLDKNTEALHKAVKNNEIIVANHLSSEKERWNHVIKVLEPVTREIEELNKWHRDNGK